MVCLLVLQMYFSFVCDKTNCRDLRLIRRLLRRRKSVLERPSWNRVAKFKTHSMQQEN